MLNDNNQAPQPDRREGATKRSHLMTRRSVVLGILEALVPITALVVAAVGALLTMLNHSS